MGVFDELRKVVDHFRRLGKLVYKTEWRETRAGARTYEFLVDPRSGETLEYDLVPSTYGTHPHVVFAVDPDLDETFRISYNRSSRGTENRLVLEKCRILRKKADEYSDIALSCIRVAEVNLDRDEELDEAIVRKLGEELVKAFNKFGIEVG